MNTPDDTYYALLENSRINGMEDFGSTIGHVTPDFDQATYEKARGCTFETFRDAYTDWVAEGRSQGLTYAPGKDTVLKIALKVKDEPELLSAWIDHHASIVGLHNLIVLDTGSVDPAHWEILRKVQDKVLVVNYEKHYNTSHFPWQNREFYNLLTRSCRYFTVLDADEFLARRTGDELSSADIVSTLRASTTPVFAGTWIYNATPPQIDSELTTSASVTFSTKKEPLVAGTVAGKSIVSSRHFFDARYVGHNMHIAQVVELLEPASFGVFAVLHVKTLPTSVVRNRARNHLTTLGLLSTDMSEAAATDRIRTVMETTVLSPRATRYIGEFLDATTPTSSIAEDSESVSWTMRLEDLARSVHAPGLDAVFREIDFAELRDSAAASLAG